MAKMGNGTGLRKIPLSQIVDTGNVRENYEGIAELAESILKHGQLEPALVKAMEPDQNGERFEIVAGHRRHRAIQFLCDRKESITTLDAVVVTGDKLTIQLVENLQRSDLTADERERGIYQMCKNGLSQKEVAARLSKPEAYVSRNVSAYKIREAAKAAGIDTESIATATLNEIQAAKAADYAGLVKDILKNGGTSEAARAVMENYRVTHGKPANPKGKKESKTSDPLSLHPSPVTDPIVEEFSESGVDVEVDVETGPAESPPKKVKTDAASTSWVDDYEPPPHKQIDFNSVCLTIMNYANEVKNTETKVDTCEECKRINALAVIEHIIALLHAEL